MSAQEQDLGGGGVLERAEVDGLGNRLFRYSITYGIVALDVLLQVCAGAAFRFGTLIASTSSPVSAARGCQRRDQGSSGRAALPSRCI
jgi:hypothetical protein